MKQFDVFRANAANCAEHADAASEQPTQLRYRRMETAWLAWQQSKLVRRPDISPI
jgi:hypothetical protein